MPPITYSVIIPSYNSAETIRACLDSIVQQRFDWPYEILVVDSSTDATPEIVRQEFPQVHLIHLDVRTEPGPARNLGIQQAQGDILCFIDSDCVAEPDWLRLLAEAHDNGEYAAVGGAILNGNPEKLVGWAGYFAEFREFFPFHNRQCMSNVPTCNISYRRWVFERYGGFPDILPDSISPKHPQQEDLVFNLNLYKHRDSILFDPSIRVAHTNVTSIGKFLIHQYRIGRSTSQLLKHFPYLSGGMIASSRFLTCLAIPFLPGIKFLNTFRIAVRSRYYLKHFLTIAPLLLLGLLIWGIGFVKGSFLVRRFPRNTKALIEKDRVVRWEAVRWILHVLTLIPGEIGAWMRKWIVPFRARGDNIRIMEHVWIERPDNLTLGENCRINRGVYIQASGGVDIGSNVGIGPGALIYSLNHNFRDKDRLYHEQGYTEARVIIEDDVWIASYAKIMPGVTVCQGTVVGAGAVVTKDTEPYSIVAGVPAKVIGYRT